MVQRLNAGCYRAGDKVTLKGPGPSHGSSARPPSPSSHGSLKVSLGLCFQWDAVELSCKPEVLQALRVRWLYRDQPGKEYLLASVLTPFWSAAFPVK